MRSIYEDLAGLMRLLGTAALSLVLVGSLVVGQAAWSEEAETEDENEEDAYTEDIYLMEEAIVVGSRHAPRSEKESAAPVDVLNADELRTQAAVDMDDMLRTLAPSYNIQRHGIDDEATLVRPATLRGLPPDNLLVLVNGKRRHRSGVIALLGSSLNTGSQGPDLSVIPAIALTQMELLRDGAAASVRVRRHCRGAEPAIARSLPRSAGGNAGRPVLRGRRPLVPGRGQCRSAAY